MRRPADQASTRLQAGVVSLLPALPHCPLQLPGQQEEVSPTADPTGLGTPSGGALGDLPTSSS